MDTHVKRPADAQERNRPGLRNGQPQDINRDESEIDRILADSFPASDPPPWTLGRVEGPCAGDIEPPVIMQSVANSLDPRAALT